jgi:hypothetical protein
MTAYKSIGEECYLGKDRISAKFGEHFKSKFFKATNKRYFSRLHGIF